MIQFLRISNSFWELANCGWVRTFFPFSFKVFEKVELFSWVEKALLPEHNSIVICCTSSGSCSLTKHNSSADGLRCYIFFLVGKIKFILHVTFAELTPIDG